LGLADNAHQAGADTRRLGQLPRVGATDLQCHRMLVKRIAQQPVEEPAVAVGPIHIGATANLTLPDRQMALSLVIFCGCNTV
jgi:hypothetical protein